MISFGRYRVSLENQKGETMSRSLSIITINRNNTIGLEKTMQSVLSQTCTDFEYIVVDGASTDGSVDVIHSLADGFDDRLKWVSDPDSGIYNAMNKGIRMASGEYIQILNSGDSLASGDVTERMLAELERQGKPAILYGNMVKCFPDGHQVVDKCFAGQEITMLGMFTGTLNHNPAYIRRDLFDKYGYYDESLKICSDWKWYIQAIVLGGEVPAYVDLNVTYFDMTGVSETTGSREKIKVERRKVLAELFPKAILSDYEAYSQDIYVMRRLHRFPWACKLVWFLERSLFKVEKRRKKRMKVQIWG